MLFTELDVFDREHSNRVLAMLLLNFDHGLAIGVTAVTQARTEITVQDWIHSQNIVALRIIEMALISDIVKVRKVLTQRTFILALLQDVLSFVPVPSLINFAKILNDQIVALDAFLPLAKNTETFGMHTEMWVDFITEILDCS